MKFGRKSIYVFSPFRFYPESGELHFRNRIVRCPVQAANVLRVLLLHAGDVVTRDQLRAELWPDGDSFSYDEAINKAISYLRSALSDRSRAPVYIETLPKRGYRFMAPVTQETEGEAERDNTSLVSATQNNVVHILGSPEDDVALAMPENDERTTISPRRHLFVPVIAISVTCILLLAGWWFYLHRVHSRTHEPSQTLRIGIAPFEASGAGADALAESFRLDMTDTLAQSPYLRVNAVHGISSGREQREAVVALHADILVFGELISQGGRVDLNIELTRGNDETHLANFKYNVDADQMIQLRQQVRQDLLDTLKPSRSGHGPAVGSTENAQAYAEYLKARSGLRQWNNDSWKQAIAQFRHVIVLDPNFAKAYSGLASTLIAMARHQTVPEAQAYQEAWDMAQKSLELDPQLAEAYVALGSVAEYKWDLRTAEMNYRRAIELDPAQSRYRLALASLLCMQGRLDESIRELQLAHALDPAWESPYLAAIFIYSSANQPDRSVAVGKQLLEMDPNSVLAHRQLGWSYWYAGKYEQAVQEWRRTAELAKDADRLTLEDEGLKALESGGPKAYAVLRLKAIESGKKWNHSSDDFVTSEWFVYAGQTDNAIAALTMQISRHESAALQIAVDPAYQTLQSDARYQRLVHQMGVSVPAAQGRRGWHGIWD